MYGKLLFCIAGIYACFLTWGILQERVSTTPYFARTDLQRQGPSVRFTHFVFLNMIQSAAASLIAYLYLKFIRGQSLYSEQTPLTQALLGQYLKVAILSTLASPFGYASLKHVDYPTMILAKSCKLLPVMLMSFLMHRRTFDWYKYVSVLLITAGVSVFMLGADGSSGRSKGAMAGNSLWGLLLLGMNLMIDGATNSSQDHIFITYRVTGPQMMFFMNAFSTVVMFLYLGILTPILNPTNANDLLEALRFSHQYPASIVDVLLFGVCGGLGQTFIFYTLEQFGSLILVTVNVTRKMVSMLLSVVWFNHVLSWGQWTGVSLVFLGIGLEAQMTRMQKQQQKKQQKTIEDFRKVVDEPVVIRPATSNNGPVLRQRNKKKT